MPPISRIYKICKGMHYISIMSAQNQLSFFTIPITKQRSRDNRWKNFYSVYAYDYTTYHYFSVDVWDKTNLIKTLTFSLSYPTPLLALCYYAILIFPLKITDEPKYRKLFFAHDEDGELQPLGDEKHIYRTQTLYRLYEKLYNYTGVTPFEKFYTKDIDGLRVWREEYQPEEYIHEGKKYQGQKFTEHFAEIIGTESLSLKIRVILHIRLLRYLRQGYSIKEGIQKSLQSIRKE